jgi:hypothetical protein
MSFPQSVKSSFTPIKTNLFWNWCKEKEYAAAIKSYEKRNKTLKTLPSQGVIPIYMHNTVFIATSQVIGWIIIVYACVEIQHVSAT